jgi:hypothetical protein
MSSSVDIGENSSFLIFMMFVQVVLSFLMIFTFIVPELEALYFIQCHRQILVMYDGIWWNLHYSSYNTPHICPSKVSTDSIMHQVILWQILIRYLEYSYYMQFLIKIWAIVYSWRKKGLFHFWWYSLLLFQS